MLGAYLYSLIPNCKPISFQTLEAICQIPDLNLDHLDAYGAPAIHYVAALRHIDNSDISRVYSMLVKAGANINILDRKRKDALRLCLYYKGPNQLLLQTFMNHGFILGKIRI